ncbi:SDR family NAD(P)-dependent oxidoreductase [Halobacillus sp. B23F22_1]|uniref:SDR family NAD(P)-dependent oxidoreductase n=1 Tax=Halobacillus sp. B23F22_1 TaxID=3459514 RepID=UPI00373E8C97
MKKILKGKKILITGSSNGIGMYLAIHVAGKGGEPILVSRSINKLRIIKDIIEKKYDVPVHCYEADLADDQMWKDVLQSIFLDHGSLDAVINNAGVGKFDAVNESNWNDIEQMISVNIRAAFRATYETLPYLIEQRRGHIINIGSQSGKMATPKSAVYSATKHAIIGYSNALRMEAEPYGVYVTTVNLGPVKTDFFQNADPTGKYEKAVQKIMLQPNQVAREIVQTLFVPKREMDRPVWMDLGSRCYQVYPSLFETLLSSQFNKK